MKKGMTTKSKSILLIVAGVLIVIATYFLIFQKNMDKVQQLEMDNSKLSNQVRFLNSLQIRVNEMKQTSDQKLKETEKFTKEFPCKMTQQKVIYNLYSLHTHSGMELRSIKPGEECIFYQNGQFIDLSGENGSTESGSSESGSTESQDTTSESEVEKNPEKQVALEKMVGKVTPYQVDISGTRKQVLKAFDWISKNPEHMSLSGISLSFDTSTGKLVGSIQVNFYCLNGNGVNYIEPDISGIVLGNKDVFGTFTEKEK